MLWYWSKINSNLVNFNWLFDYTSTTCAVKCRDLASSLIVLWTLINVLWPATRRRLLQLHTWEVVKTLLHPSISQLFAFESMGYWKYCSASSPLLSYCILKIQPLCPARLLKTLRQKGGLGYNFWEWLIRVADFLWT